MNANRDEVMRRFSLKVKPISSLTRLEELVATFAVIQETPEPICTPRSLLLFAGDHGIADEGVSAYPSAVTRQMVRTFIEGGSASRVLADRQGVEVRVIDVGVKGDRNSEPWQAKVINKNIRQATRNFLIEPALTQDECQKALQVGSKEVQSANERGDKCLLFGEMGIGNTTSSSALFALLYGLPVHDIVGRGTGIDDSTFLKKRIIVERACALYGGKSDPFELLQCVGGLEIVALVGALIEAYKLNIVSIIDGFIVTVAALYACAAEPKARSGMIFSHESGEEGHRHALARLEASPLLSLSLSLGEGSGALLALPLIDNSFALYYNMVSFKEASVSERVIPTLFQN